MEGIESFFVCMITQADYIMNDGANHNKNGVPGCYIKQAQLRLCKLGPGTVLRHTEGGGRTHNVTQRTDTHIFTGGTHPQCNPTNGHTETHRLTN